MRVGEILQSFGQPKRGEESERQAIDLLEKLVAQFPGRPEYREDLAYCYYWLAYLFSHSGPPEEAAHVRQQSLSQYQKLVSDFPTVPKYRKQLADCQSQLGWALKDLRPKEAEKHCRQALAAWDRLAIDFPKEPVDRAALSFSHEWLGSVLMATGQFQEAEFHLLQALRLRQQAGGGPGDLAYFRAHVGDLFYQTGRPAEAEKYYRLAVEARQNAARDFPNAVAEDQRRLELEYASWGFTLFALGRTQEAEDALRRRLTLVRKLASDHPGTPPFPNHLTWASYDLGLLLQATGRPEEAAELFRGGISALEELAAKPPDNASDKIEASWALSICPAPQFRDPSRAVAFAKQGLQRFPVKPNNWRNLGVAEYRLGEWQAAIDAFRKANELENGAENWDLFFLAMAHWQLGDKGRAGKLYEQGVHWMEKNRPGDILVKSFRDEAAILLGVKEQRK